MTLPLEELIHGICSLEEIKQIGGKALDAPTVKTTGSPLIVMVLMRAAEELQAKLDFLCDNDDGFGEEDGYGAYCDDPIGTSVCERKLRIIATVCKRWEDYRLAQLN